MDSGNVNPYEPSQSEADGRGDDVSPWSKDDHDKLVTLATFDNPFDAHLLRNELQENGIAAVVANEASTSVMGATIAGPSRAFWIEVVVKQADAKAALLVKEQFLAGNSDQTFDILEWKCSCGETVDAGFGVCWNCEAEYKE